MQASEGAYNLIEGLLRTAALPLEVFDKLEREVDSGIGEITAMCIIKYLKENQRDHIRGGFSYSQTDISSKLSEF